MTQQETQLHRQPLILVGGSAGRQRLKTFLRGTSGTVASAEVQEYDTLDALTPEDIETCGAIILSAPTPQETHTLPETIRQKITPCITMTDDRDVVHTLREQGCAYFIPKDDLNATLLMDTILAAQDMAVAQRERHTMAIARELAEKRFHDMADQFADWLWEIDKNLNIVFSSSRKRPAQGAESGKPFTGCFLPEEKMRIEDDFTTLFRSPQSFQDRDYWSFDAYGTRMCWAVSGVPVKDEAGEIVGFRGVGRDISTAKSTADKLYHMANNDPVTGLFNRNRFFDELGRVVRLAERENRSGSLIVMNIDHFSYINETHGHDVGDKLLIHIAQTLQDHLRSGEMLARVAGDEFAVLLPDVMQDLDSRLERIEKALRTRPMPLTSGTLTYQFSMGIVRFPAHGKDADTLFSRAMQTLKQAKEKGRNRIEIFQETTKPDTRKAENLNWLNFITKCLDEEQERVVLYYQPIVPLDDKGHTQFYEVLVRMIDEDGEIIVPTKFIEAAEDFGIVSKIDRLVTTRAIQTLQHWRQQGRNVHLSVNISAKTFDDDAFLDDIAEVLKESGLPRGSLVFEITETSLLRDLARVRHFITKMKEVGAGFALDDCGVGYSSFNYIRHLDLDFIKIDGSFVRNLHISDDDDAFVQALHDVAKQKQINTVAEMVEHDETAKKLKKMGVEYGQGFYFATPMPEIPEEDTDIH